jgi:hypothetical protein
MLAKVFPPEYLTFLIKERNDNANGAKAPNVLPTKMVGFDSILPVFVRNFLRITGESTNYTNYTNYVKISVIRVIRENF